MLEKNIRPVLQLLLMPTARILNKFTKVTPLAMVVVLLSAGVATLPLMLLNFKILAVSLLWLAYLLEIVNYNLAKLNEGNQAVNILYTQLSQRVSEFAVILGFYLLSAGIIAWINILILASNLLSVTSYLSLAMLMPKPNNELYYQSFGLLDRIGLLTIFSIIIIFPKTYGVLGIALAALLLCTTAFRMLELQTR
jgi:hypothetical protein